MSARRTQKEKIVKTKFSMHLMWKQRYLLMMSLPFVVWLIIFKYIPLWGWTMAFQEVKPKNLSKAVWERPFTGVENILKAFSDRVFKQTMINTIGLSILGIAVGTLMAILFALMLNEIRFVKFKKITQTISYLPHFVSWVVIASIAKMVLNDGGMLDTALHTKLGLMSTNSPLFWATVVLINTWKEVGWDAIVYLSAMAGIDQGLYEAAKVDGANRLQRIWHITLPGIKPTIVVLLIMGIGGALNVGMERQMLLSNGIVQDHAMVLSWFSYVRGIGNSNYGLGTAIGMFQSLVGILLLFLANKIAGWLGESRLI